MRPSAGAPDNQRHSPTLTCCCRQFATLPWTYISCICARPPRSYRMISGNAGTLGLSAVRRFRRMGLRMLLRPYLGHMTCGTKVQPSGRLRAFTGRSGSISSVCGGAGAPCVQSNSEAWSRSDRSGIRLYPAPKYPLPRMRDAFRCLP